MIGDRDGLRRVGRLVDSVVIALLLLDALAAWGGRGGAASLVPVSLTAIALFLFLGLFHAWLGHALAGGEAPNDPQRKRREEATRR